MLPDTLHLGTWFHYCDVCTSWSPPIQTVEVRVHSPHAETCLTLCRLAGALEITSVTFDCQNRDALYFSSDFRQESHGREGIRCRHIPCARSFVNLTPGQPETPATFHHFTDRKGGPGRWSHLSKDTNRQDNDCCSARPRLTQFWHLRSHEGGG